jgi:hypothetical protein
MLTRNAKALIPFSYVAAVLSICQYAFGDEQVRLTVDDFDLSGDGAPYEAAKLIAENWFRKEHLEKRPEYEIPVYSLKGRLVGYYFIGYSGEGTPPAVKDIINEYRKSNIMEISRKHGEPHPFIKYGKDLRTLTIYTRFGNGGPMTGSCNGIPQTMVWKYQMDESARRVLGTGNFVHKYVDFESFQGSVYSSEEKAVYFSILPYFGGEEKCYRSLDEVY